MAVEIKQYKTCEDWLAAQNVSEFTGVTVEHVYAAWEHQEQRVAELKLGLSTVAQALAWHNFGECRSYGIDVPLLTLPEADALAKELLGIPDSSKLFDFELLKPIVQS